MNLVYFNPQSYSCLKGVVDPKAKTLSSFAHPCVVPKPVWLSFFCHHLLSSPLFSRNESEGRRAKGCQYWLLSVAKGPDLLSTSGMKERTGVTSFQTKSSPNKGVFEVASEVKNANVIFWKSFILAVKQLCFCRCKHFFISPSFYCRHGQRRNVCKQCIKPHLLFYLKSTVNWGLRTTD